MIRSDIPVTPIEPIKHHTCGSCIYHIPTKRKLAPKIKEGKGIGEPANWVCGCKGCKHYEKGRVCEDGYGCEHYENRYENEEKVNEWLPKTVRGANSKPIRQVRGNLQQHRISKYKAKRVVE